MRAVNLIPGDARPGTGVKVSGGLGPAYAVIGLLGVAVLLVSVYVLTSNTISDRQSKLATLQTQVTQEQAQASRLTNFASFLKLTQARVETVRQIASSRFDWHAALADLSEVIPANTSLQSLTGTVAPGASVSGAGGSAGGSALRGAIASPAFEMQGCTKSQDDVARLMSRLRLINGVQRVTLASSIKQDGAQAGAGVASGSGASAGCGANAPTFDLVVFFAAMAGASVPAAPGASTAAATPTSASTAASGSTSPGTAATSPATSTPAVSTAAASTPAASTPAASTPAASTPAPTPGSPAPPQPVSSAARAQGSAK